MAKGDAEASTESFVAKGDAEALPDSFVATGDIFGGTLNGADGIVVFFAPRGLVPQVNFGPLLAKGDRDVFPGLDAKGDAVDLGAIFFWDETSAMVSSSPATGRFGPLSASSFPEDSLSSVFANGDTVDFSRTVTSSAGVSISPSLELISKSSSFAVVAEG